MATPTPGTLEHLEILTAAILGLSRYFVGVPYDLPPAGDVIEGYDKLHPVYRAVTENRDGPGPVQRKKYSSCGDQPHAILQRLGIHHPMLNRGGQYEVGGNITRLQKFPFSHAVGPADAFRLPPPGSLCLIWNTGFDAHALVIHGEGSDKNHVLTANYGAGGMNAGTKPGANMADSPLSVTPAGLHIGKAHRRLRSYITPASLVPYLTGPIDLTGAIVTSDVIQALGARWDHA